MKYFGIIFLLLTSNVIFAAVGDQVTTSAEVVGTISVDANDTVYIVSADGNWSTPDCPNAMYVYFRAGYASDDKVYSAALASKVSKTPIVFKGICGDVGGNGSYIQLNYMTF